jgi:hypothetical protein
MEFDLVRHGVEQPSPEAFGLDPFFRRALAELVSGAAWGVPHITRIEIHCRPKVRAKTLLAHPHPASQKNVQPRHVTKVVGFSNNKVTFPAIWTSI